MRKKLFIFFLMPIVLYGESWKRSLKNAAASSAYYAQDYDKAAACYEGLLVDDPFNKEAIRGVADCLYSKKSFEDAEKYYRQLIMRPDNSPQEREEFYFNHGCSLAQLKNFKEALASFEEVVKINSQNERAQKNIEILKKLLEEQQQDKKQDKDDKQDKKDQDKQDQNKQDQQDKQNQNDQQNDQQKSDQESSDQSENDQSDKEQQDGKDQDDLDKERNKNERQQDKQQEQQKQPDQQKEQQGGSDSKEDKQGDEQKKEGQEQQQQPHNDSSQKQEDQQQKQQTQGNEKKEEEQQLPVQMQALLQQAGELEKRGQQLYMRALAGQQESSGADHAW